MDHWESPGISDLGNFMPNFTRLLRTQSTLACVSCAGPVACLGWTAGQHDLERWFSKFQLNSSLRKNTKYSEDDTVGAVLYSGRCEMQLLREAQRVSMAKCDFCTVSAWRSDKPTSHSHQCQDAHDSTRAAWPRAWSKEFELSSLHFSILKDRRTIPAKCSREPLFSHVPTSLNVYCLPE